jgi:NAD(P)-dependent dehydrogenase (short-subunit alcohol dehydrogenase family)
MMVGTGRIINIGSMAGSIGLAGGAAYGATKAALASLAQAWAAEYSASGVRVNTVAPRGARDQLDRGRVGRCGTADVHDGTHLIKDLAWVFRFKATPAPIIERSEYIVAVGRLRAAGYRAGDGEAHWERFANLRSNTPRS